MQFMLMCCFDEQRWNSLPEAQRQRIMQDYGKFEQDLGRHHLASIKLESISTAAIVRERNGKRVTTDGPFAETKEQLGGVHLIECKDLEEAIAIAGRIPTLPAGGVVEVRPVMRMVVK
jgi:hypothetical protein